MEQICQTALDNPKLNELQLIFPDKTKTQLSNALGSADGNLHHACTLLLSESTSEEESRSETPNALGSLRAMFPEVDSATIDEVYKRSDSIESATSELLSLPLLSLVDGEEQKNTEKQFKSKKSRNALNSSENGREASWKSIPEKIKLIRLYTGVSDSNARRAFHESSLDMVKAIVRLIWGQEYFESNSDEVKVAHTKTSRPKAKQGRVQAGTGFAHATKQNSFEIISSNATSSDGKERIVKDASEPYVYYDESREARELQDILRSNTDMRTISLPFLKRALCFYHGDLQRTISLALFIIESDGSKATYGLTVPTLDSKELFSFKIAGHTLPKTKETIMEPANGAQLNSHEFQSEEHYLEGLRMIENVFTRTRLDFHGFVPQDAIRVLKHCLNKWWTQEMKDREMNSQNLYVSKALNVTPLEVVTGRGIHSAGGVSTLKIKVRKYLDGENYLYWEEPAYFVIEGKKCRK